MLTGLQLYGTSTLLSFRSADGPFFPATQHSAEIQVYMFKRRWSPGSQIEPISAAFRVPPGMRVVKTPSSSLSAHTKTVHPPTHIHVLSGARFTPG